MMLVRHGPENAACARKRRRVTKRMLDGVEPALQPGPPAGLEVLCSTPYITGNATLCQRAPCHAGAACRTWKAGWGGPTVYMWHCSVAGQPRATLCFTHNHVQPGIPNHTGGRVVHCLLGSAGTG